MTEEKINQEFRLKEINEKINYFMEEIKKNELISKKHKMVCEMSNYTEYLLILPSTVTAFFSIFALTSLIGMPLGNASSAVTINLCKNCGN